MAIKFARIIFALTVIANMAGGCKVRGPQEINRGAPLKGLSASANADNVALLMTAYSHSPGYGSYFETDMEQFRRIVTDPAGNYRFKTMVDHRVGHHQMLANIRAAAAQVSEGGTLLLFLAAHGSTAGQIQPEDQRYTTLGYNEILQAIRDGRKGKSFRRFVLFVSACYSGSWFQTLQSSGGLFKERLVISSVGPNQLSWIAQASRGMLQAFGQLKNNQNATLADLINQTRSNVGDVLYSANPESMMNESLINPVTTDSGAGDSSTDKPDDDGRGGDKSNDRPDETPVAVGRVFAITVYQRSGNVKLFVYSEKKAAKIEMKTGKGWWELTDAYDPQPNIQTILATEAHPSWGRVSSLPVRVTMPDGSVTELDANIEHR